MSPPWQSIRFFEKFKKVPKTAKKGSKKGSKKGQKKGVFQTPKRPFWTPKKRVDFASQGQMEGNFAYAIPNCNFFAQNSPPRGIFDYFFRVFELRFPYILAPF
jgi:hypothetical protein